ncbi:ankyrin repeat domain-containing protein [Streptomyces sp. SP18CS02]|uniref:ankyrin repeat domain-containing protein n=1 Tax=Streptomyces sp. SP18CS02 TaxID=3002531 RepID=UPI002E763926|nr:ankyrin repeat domain-containing protein [Streptomyces sp. SP18CS02]MEE1756489.1 ankyrin repeat domain-containing protein [Streptomyces sp. SP18CS02]
MLTLSATDELAVDVTGAIRSGDPGALRLLLAEHPGLAAATIRETREDRGPGVRSLLHIAADWPGHFPGGPQVVAVLVAAGADPDARFAGHHRETPLHWAASNDDVPLLDALVRAGADIEASGAVIGGGTPLADARGFGQWRAARRLVEHGARVDLQDAATLGLLDRVEAYATAPVPPTPEEITSAFWGACHGGHLPAVEYLHRYGPDIDWIGYDGMTPLGVARAHGADEVVHWLTARGATAGPAGQARADGGARP